MTGTERRWVLAARPATLWAAVAPVLVGSAIAVDDGAFRWDAFLVTMFAALCIQVGVNFANDLSDAVRGADTEERIGPARAVAGGLITPAEMKRGIVVSFGLATLAGIYLTWLGGWVIVLIGATSIVAALAYTGGPIPYGYRGLGEVFVFVFFGLVATVGTRYVFDRSAPEAAWIAAVPMGLLAAAILVANNLRDIETDRTAGKRTLAVMLGRSWTQRLFAGCLMIAYLTIAVAAATGSLPVWALLCLASVPLAVTLLRTAMIATSGPKLIGLLKGTARLQLVFAVLLAVGVVI